MERKLEILIEQLNHAHAKNLISIVLYGSAVIGERQEERSDYNILVVLDRITPADLRAAHSVVDQWNREGNPLPLYFTQEEMRRASDVFPIEFLDMSRVHKVLHGLDPFESLEIPRANLRHQLEYELRGKLIRLRELYIPMSNDSERLSALMVDSLNSFVVLFRHVLSLLSEEPPVTKLETLVHLRKKLGLDVTPLLKVLELGQQKQVLSPDQATEFFAAYLSAIEATIRRVDELGESGRD